MLNRIFSIFLVFSTLFIYSCAPKPKVVLPITGSPLTPEWEEYNRQAEAKNAPKLVYLATCKRIGGEKGRKVPKDITDNFSEKDERFYIYTKWSNVLGKSNLELKIYDPRGILFYEGGRMYEGATKSWNIWYHAYIQDAPASKLPGKWRAEISMDGVLAARKKFVIGSEDIQYKQISFGKEAPAIGVLPFIPKARRGERYMFKLPTFMARMLTIDFPAYRVILPETFKKEIPIPSGRLEHFVNESMKSELFNDVIRKHNIRVCIAGSVYDEGMVGQDKIFEIFIIDAESKSIAKKLSARWTSQHSYEYSTSSLITDACNSVYKYIMKKAKDDINLILKRE